MPRRVLLRSAILVVGMGLPIALSAIRAVTELAAVRASTGGSPADLGTRQRMMEFLADPDGLGATPRVVMAEIGLGPMIVYETPHATICSPYHRNVQGVVDADAFFTDEGEETARRIVDERGVGLVLIERPRREEPPPADGVEALGTRLLCGRGPSWSTPVELPAELALNYSLWTID